MVEEWGLEFIKGLVKLFLNPLVYWFGLLIWLTASKRIKRERNQFGRKIFNLFSESQNTWKSSLVFSIIISGLSLVFGLYVTFETIILLAVITIILSITGSTKLLSAAYTLGITCIVMYLLPLTGVQWFDTYLVPEKLIGGQLTSIAILIGLFILVEALMIKMKQKTYPVIVQGNRGRKVGQHHLKAMTLLPFICFVPTDYLGGLTAYFPLFEVNGITFNMIIIPFIIGYDYKIKGDLPSKLAGKFSKELILLSILVLGLGVSAVFYPFMSLVAVGTAIIGRIFISVRLRLLDSLKIPYFRPLDNGMRVLAIIPDGPADRLGIKVGETISKVNGLVVTDSTEFYEALQNSGAFFKLEVLDDINEVRFITSAFYEEDHHELGLIFPESYYRVR